MQIDIHDFGLWVLSIVVGVLAFFIKRTLAHYDDNIKMLAKSINDFTSSFKDTITEFHKEIGQIRLEAALLKQSSIELSKYNDKISSLEKANVILESQVKAAFAVLSGKRKMRPLDGE